VRIQLGAGNVIIMPSTDGNPAVPSSPRLVGTLQDFNFDNSGTLKELRSQYQYADDVGVTDKKATWKMGSGRFDIDLFNNMFGGETMATGGEAIVVQETHTLGPSAPYTIIVTHSVGFSKDGGVQNATTGQPLQKVSSVTATGQYSVSAGTYTFFSDMAGQGVAITYTYTILTGSMVTVHNQVMGFAPKFEIYVVETYQELTSGVPNYLHLFSCRATKFSLPFKRADYLVCDIEGEAFANSAIPPQVYSLYED
jgi:hypothetical protein